MSRIAQTFERLASQGRTALMPFLTIGYPERDSALSLAQALVAGGADMLELGMPFSDPLADGATIQRTTDIALANGVDLEFCLETVRQLRAAGLSIPLLLMGYFNPMFQYGVERFVAAAKAAGADGFIVPDLPPEEAQEFHAATKAHALDLVFLLAPTSTDARIAKVTGLSSGFIYCVALRGVTGARAALADDLGDFLARVRQHSHLPRAVGFGISKPEHVASVAKMAEGAICASALLDYIGSLPSDQQAAGAQQFVQQLRDAADQANGYHQ
ncbi:tryptophan synthase subunit alpha [Herpetosiphon llansteffanensis]|uniref:tryptophan synthase subunit alpha n=1 Tax=Herpetosiphon llansteffanensis TaxID=2094568 RepID=UPI000D7C71A1|nr:tryptophan synthase subunit alpha [Herpetosiphon llansteffanensis]